jgi:hypothetical protein
MTTLNLTLPKSIERHLKEMADIDGVPVDQFSAPGWCGGKKV